MLERLDCWQRLWGRLGWVRHRHFLALHVPVRQPLYGAGGPAALHISGNLLPLLTPAPCRARRPFHPGRLWALLRRFWLLQQVDGLAEAEEGAEDLLSSKEGEEGGMAVDSEESGRAAAGGSKEKPKQQPAGKRGRQGGRSGPTTRAAAGGSDALMADAAPAAPAAAEQAEGGPATGDHDDSGPGMVIVAEAATAAEVAARQAELKHRFGQVWRS